MREFRFERKLRDTLQLPSRCARPDTNQQGHRISSVSVQRQFRRLNTEVSSLRLQQALPCGKTQTRPHALQPAEASPHGPALPPARSQRSTSRRQESLHRREHNSHTASKQGSYLRGVLTGPSSLQESCKARQRSWRYTGNRSSQLSKLSLPLTTSKGSR